MMISARAVEVLREERVKLLKVVEQIDAILDADGTAPSASDERPRHDTPTGRKRGQQRRYDWDAGRVMYETGAPVKDIADALVSARSRPPRRAMGGVVAANRQRRNPATRS